MTIESRVEALDDVDDDLPADSGDNACGRVGVTCLGVVRRGVVMCSINCGFSSSMPHKASFIPLAVSPLVLTAEAEAAIGEFSLHSGDSPV